MNPPLPPNLTRDPEPESNTKPVLKIEESSGESMKPPSPRNPNLLDLGTTEAVIAESNTKIPPRVRYYLVVEYVFAAINSF